MGTPRSRIQETRPIWETLAWEKIRDTVHVKSFTHSDELYVVAKSAKRFVTIELPKEEEELNGQTFRFKLDKEKLKDAALYDGHYLLRSNLSNKEPKYLWELYMLLVEIEAVFRSFKNDLGIRPVYHQREPRVDAHIFVCFQAYCLYVTLKHWLKPLASGLTSRQALEQFAKVQMLDVVFPTTDGKKLVMSRYTQADDGLKLLMARMKKEFGEQPPPKLRTPALEWNQAEPTWR